ncbi:hypothetical protein THRCLA_07150 [Thraustotheca clavata]|uniref:Uncharacterized protein n=1 Tax=Thraustotheca clavata TaxID=74557 RepID=A0A1V9ZFT7_9STRA|nr:hypothetical protein THRCLA_07150 [Thraustotheca clavata]
MKEVYDIVPEIPNAQAFYEYLLTLDEYYTPALAEILTRCPRTDCCAELPLNEVYLMHFCNQTIFCPNCRGAILYETFMLAQFVKNCPLFKVECTLQKEKFGLL